MSSLPPPTDLLITVSEDLDHFQVAYAPKGASGHDTLVGFLGAVAIITLVLGIVVSPELWLITVTAAGMAGLVSTAKAAEGKGEVRLTASHLTVKRGRDEQTFLLEEVTAVRVVPMALELTTRDGSRHYLLRQSGSTLAGWMAPLIRAHVEQRRAALEASGHDLREPAQPPEALLALAEKTTRT